MFSYLNIGVLLNLNKDARILFLGSGLNEWYKSFSEKYEDCGFNPDMTLNELGHIESPYDLIILGSFNFSTKIFNENIQKLSCLLKLSGFLIVLGYNRYNFKNCIKKYFLRREMDWQFITGRGATTYRKVLKKNGFNDIIEFATEPNSPDYGKIIWLDDYKYSAKKNTCKFLFLANQTDINSYQDVIKKIISVLCLNDNNTDIKVDRIEFRVRGALIIYLKNHISNKGFIVRSSSSEKINEIIKVNAENINYIINDIKVVNTISNKLPTQIAIIENDGNLFYVEEMKNGVLSWSKAIDNSIVEEKILQESIDFKVNLERTTKKEIFVTQQFFDRVYRSNLKNIYSQNFIGKKIRNGYEKIVENIEAKVLHKNLIFVLSHGDYGYGNILVDEYGNITGVIDWDAAKHNNIPGYDLFNLMFARDRILKGKEYIDVLECLGGASLDSGLILPLADGTYEKEFCIDKTNIGIVIATFCIEWVSSGARYEDEFLKASGHSESFFQWALDNCF